MQRDAFLTARSILELTATVIAAALVVSGTLGIGDLIRLVFG